MTLKEFSDAAAALKAARQARDAARSAFEAAKAAVEAREHRLAEIEKFILDGAAEAAPVEKEESYW